MKRWIILIAAAALVLALSLTAGGVLGASKAGSSTTTVPPTAQPTDGAASASAAPATPPVTWCSSGFSNPYTKPPAGAVTIPAGNNSSSVLVNNYTMKPNTVYWFAKGTHTIGGSPFSQIQPAPGDTFIGAPGAILDGQGKNDYAFVMNSIYPEARDTGVTIEYLTIQNFIAGEGEAAVGQGGYVGWTIQYNLIRNNPNGAGVALGTKSTVTNNCLTNNGEYGFNSFQSNHVNLTNNEISNNDAAGLYDHAGGPNPDCGCAGGGKFWQTTDANVTGNYVHDNGDPGLWADTNNKGFNISHNYVSNNYAEGIMYEVSYNAHITNNTLVGNDIGAGKDNLTPDFPGSAIYVSESGADPRVNSWFNQHFLISGNVLTDNWGGITLYENANRACGLSNDDLCTLIDPSAYTLASCGAHLATAMPTGTPDYFDNCRWKTQNVTVEHNTFNFTPAHLGSACTKAASTPDSYTGCGFNGLFSEYGSDTPYKAWVVPNNISNHQNNRFLDNTYNGPWKFEGFGQGTVMTWAQWTAGTSNSNSSGDPFPAQDSGSAYHN